jgi:P-type E1-E2 ATPase
VENALSAKPRIQDLADKVASWFVPAVVAVAMVVLAIWVGVAVEVRKENAGGAIGTSMTYAIAVLAVSCPCALGLAVPMVLVIAGGVAARAGVIIKAADATERGYKVTDVVFDKTGTLTKGDLQVVEEQSFPASSILPEEATSLVAKLVEDNNHPVSKAVAAHLGNEARVQVTLGRTQSVPGSGIEASWNGQDLRAGNPYWLGIEGQTKIIRLLDQGMTLFCVTLNGSPILVYGLKSTLRDEAGSVVELLKHRNITCHVVSGDAPKVVEDVASTLRIDIDCVASRASPADKQLYVKRLQSAGKIVLFVGDGTNDAVAVAQANVGAQIGNTSDVTSAVTDVVLLNGLNGVITLLDVSKRAYHRIIFNFVWTAVYNVFAQSLHGFIVVATRGPKWAMIGAAIIAAPLLSAAAYDLDNKSLTCGLLFTGAFAMGIVESVSITTSTFPLRSQEEIGEGGGLSGSIRNFTSAIAIAVYVATLNNRLATTIPANINPLVNQGLPESSITSLVAALTGAGTFDAVAGLTPALQTAAQAAYRMAFKQAASTVFLVVLAFSGPAIILALFTQNNDPATEHYVAGNLHADADAKEHGLAGKEVDSDAAH